MSEAGESSAGFGNEIHTLWRRQWLVATSAQLERRGLPRQTIRRSVKDGRLHLVCRGVYSPVPPDLIPFEGRIAAALLIGGADASLFAELAAWHLKLLKREPVTLHIATRHAKREVDGVYWHRPKLRADETCKPGPFLTTTPLRTSLDLAVTFSLEELKYVLAELEYHYDIQAEQVLALRRQGHPGVKALHAAARVHTPQLAQTRSHLEAVFLKLLIAYGFKLPQFNHPSGFSTVDALYHEERVAIELDGVRSHSGQRRILRDHRRDLHRRREGYTPLRYHYTQLIKDQHLVVADLQLAGIPQG